ncbi:hypothetical protein [Kitasatospora sp. NPDC005751]|uniref:hypothetical protein n=1 Tax=Kitasatospora sp. NPDC005751 TaxID=3157064 RepID=UPI003408EC53
MTNPPPPRPAYAPTPGLVTNTWHTPGQWPAPTGTVFAAPAAPIRELPADHHQTVDWVRVRRAVRACCRPAVLTGLALSPVWARFASDLAESRGLLAVTGLGFMAAVFAGIAEASGRSHRAITIVVLVAAGAGTIQLLPTAVAAALMEN